MSKMVCVAVMFDRLAWGIISTASNVESMPKIGMWMTTELGYFPALWAAHQWPTALRSRILSGPGIKAIIKHGRSIIPVHILQPAIPSIPGGFRAIKVRIVNTAAIAPFKMLLLILFSWVDIHFL